jgi:hypothetical protein
LEFKRKGGKKNAHNIDNFDYSNHPYNLVSSHKLVGLWLCYLYLKRLKMRKIIVLMVVFGLLFVVILTACASEENSNDNTPVVSSTEVVGNDNENGDGDVDTRTEEESQEEPGLVRQGNSDQSILWRDFLTLLDWVTFWN